MDITFVILTPDQHASFGQIHPSSDQSQTQQTIAAASPAADAVADFAGVHYYYAVAVTSFHHVVVVGRVVLAANHPLGFPSWLLLFMVYLCAHTRAYVFSGTSEIYARRCVKEMNGSDLCNWWQRQRLVVCEDTIAGITVLMPLPLNLIDLVAD